jgi:hypothetical protein
MFDRRTSTRTLAVGLATARATSSKKLNGE